MDNNNQFSISIEQFAAYLDNNLSDIEMARLAETLNNDTNLQSFKTANADIDASLNQYMSGDLNLPEDIVNDSFEIPIVDFDEGVINSTEMLVGAHSLEDIIENNEVMEDQSKTLGKLTADEIQQQYPDTCAIKSQQIILESHDINVSEDELVQESMDKGWYEPGSGTAPEDVGNLLEEHGVGVNRIEHATIDDIASELAQGHQVIVGVDSGELWNPGAYETFEDFINGAGADHALIVSGINVNPLTGEREVVLTDPGTGEVAHTYTAEQFEDAWDDSDNFMMTIDF